MLSNISSELTYALGWTFFHSIWQGIIIGIVVAILLHLMKNKTAASRYLIANIGLLAMFTTAFVTFSNLYNPSIQQSSNMEGIMMYQPMIEEYSFSWINWLNTHISQAVILWIAGIAIFSMRLMGGFAYTYYLKKKGIQLLSDSMTQQINRLAIQLNLRQKVRAYTSQFVKSPIVVGWMKPVILFPIGFINQLSSEEVDAIIAHELAHVYRLDNFFNILQSVVEVIFYYHPVVWWISSKVRTEREHACDDIVLRLGHDSTTYAKALLQVQIFAQSTPALSMGTAGHKGVLFKRIQRILNHPNNKSRIMEKLVSILLLLVVITVMSVSKNQAEEITSTVEDIDSNELIMVKDTLPMGQNELTVETDEQKMEVSITDGKITSLKVDGKTIPEEEYSNYEKDIDEYWMTSPDDEIPNIFFLDEDGDSRSLKIQIDEDFDFDIDDEMRKIRIVMDSIDIDWEGNVEDLDDLKEHLLEIQNEMEDEQHQLFIIQKKEMDEHRKMMEKEQEKTLIIKEEHTENAKRLHDMRNTYRMPILNMPTELPEMVNIRFHSGNWVDALIEDGLVEDAENYKVILSGKHLKINGKKMPESLHQKYLKMYEAQNGTELSKKSKIVIEKN